MIVVDADRPTNQHGTPPKLLKCEFAALGYRMVDFQMMPAAGGYLAAFEPVGARPEPGAIRVCNRGESFSNRQSLLEGSGMANSYSRTIWS